MNRIFFITAVPLCSLSFDSETAHIPLSLPKVSTSFTTSSLGRPSKSFHPPNTLLHYYVYRLLTVWLVGESYLMSWNMNINSSMNDRLQKKNKKLIHTYLHQHQAKIKQYPKERVLVSYEYAMHEENWKRSRISSKLIFASCVWYFDRTYYVPEEALYVRLRLFVWVDDRLTFYQQPDGLITMPQQMASTAGLEPAREITMGFE